MPQVKYVTLLGNVNKTILNVKLGDGFVIEEWPTDKFVEFYMEMDTTDHDVCFKIEDAWGYGYGRISHQPKHVYISTKTLEDFPVDYKGKDRGKWRKSFEKRERFESREYALLEDKILKLHLCSEGSIKAGVEFFYSEDNGFLEMLSSREEIFPCENRLFRVNKANASIINKLLRSPPLKTSHKYISFALENFSLSYEVAHPEIEFISLMMSLEAIFNDGKQELRNKVSRGCAVLLGKTKSSSRRIFKDLKDLYDKRSVLVHTGDKSKISNNNVLSLKNYVRKSLLRTIELDIPKQKLSAQLTENGFGSYNKIG